MTLYLIGGFELISEGCTVHLPAAAQKLIAFLALQPRPVARQYVAGSLWPDVSDDRSGGNLRCTVWRLGHEGRKALRAAGGRLQLDPEVGVDVQELETMAHEILDPSTPQEPSDVGLAIEVLSSDLLPDWYDDWVALDRERLRQLRLHALESLCYRLTVAGRYADAVSAGLGAVAAEPLRESANRVLVAAYLAEGNRGEALRQYGSFRRLLADELRLTPTPLMERLVSTLR